MEYPHGKLLQFATLKPLLPSRNSWNLPSYKMVNLSIVMLVYQRVFQWYSQSIVGECSKNMVDLSIVFCIYTHRQWIKMVGFPYSCKRLPEGQRVSPLDLPIENGGSFHGDLFGWMETKNPLPRAATSVAYVWQTGESNCSALQLL